MFVYYDFVIYYILFYHSYHSQNFFKRISLQFGGLDPEIRNVLEFSKMTSLFAFRAIKTDNELIAHIEKRLPSVEESNKVWWKKLEGVRGGNTWTGWSLDFVQAATIRQVFADVRGVDAKKFALIPVSRKRKNSDMDCDYDDANDNDGDVVENSGQLKKVECHLNRITMSIAGVETLASDFSIKSSKRDAKKWSMSCPIGDCQMSFTSCLCDRGFVSSTGFKNHLRTVHPKVNIPFSKERISFNVDLNFCS